MTEDEQIMSDALNYGTSIRLGSQRIDPAQFFRSFSDEKKLADEMKAAAKMFREDARFAALVDGSVAEVRAELGPFDHEQPERHAHEMASFVASLLLARIYQRDTELAAARAERDHYRSLALNTLNSTPISPIFRSL